MLQQDDKMKVFFSYGHDCAELVFQIKNDLCERGFDIWIDASEIKTGNDWRERITSGILESDSVMAFLSKHALRKNGVCLNELSIAVGCKYGHIKTILLEPEIDSLIPPTISGIQYLDMSNWRRLKAQNEELFSNWYNEKLDEITNLLLSKETIEMNSQLKYLEQMLSPAMWQSRQQSILQKSYVPRKEAESELAKWLENETGSRSFLLYGEPGCGKSSFLVNFYHYNHEACAIAFCDWKRKSRDKLSEIIRSISFQLATKLPSYRSALVWHLENKCASICDMDEAELFENLIVTPLCNAITPEKRKCVILIDGINDLNEKNINPLAEIITSEGEKIPDFIRFIITARKCSVVPRYFDGSAFYEFQTSSESSISTVREYYELELCTILEEVDEFKRDKILDTLAQRSEGNFLFAELCVKAICEKKMQIDELDAIPCDLNGIYYKWFTVLFPDEDVYYETYYTPLAVLCAVEDPIPLELLRAVMNWSMPDLNGFFKLFKDFIKSQENALGIKTVTIFHFSMKEWLSSENAGCFQVDTVEGLRLLKNQLIVFFEEETITPYQCKLLISVLEKSKDNTTRLKVYGSRFFFEQYYALARKYESIRGGYHKALLIYTHLKEICIGLPSEENTKFLHTVYPFATSRCLCQIGDYSAAGDMISSNLSTLESSLPPENLMECYYILGSVFDWTGKRSESIDIFTKLFNIAEKESCPSYLLRALTGLIWGDHFSNIESALARLDQLSGEFDSNSIDGQMRELIRARILLSTGELDRALKLYDECLFKFDFSFQNDVRGYRKNRLLLIEILPACYDMGKYQKGIETGKQIMKKIKNTGALEECYCSSWIALNYLGMGDIKNAEKYLSRAKQFTDSGGCGGRSSWMAMHLASISAFLLSEKGMLNEALEGHYEVVDLACECNDIWVLGDACFEIAKIILLYHIKEKKEALPYIERLTELANSSGLPHLLLKSKVINALYNVLENGSISEDEASRLSSIAFEGALASTNYIDIYCLLAYIFKLTKKADGMRDAVYRIRELIYRPEYKNRPSSWQISERLRQTKESYVDFNVEYCDPFNQSENYWMRLEHLGRYIWAVDECVQVNAKVVADIACANGYGTLMLSEHADSVYGFDRSSEYIALAPKRENIEYVLSDLDELEVEQYDEKFDLITCFETIEHVKNPERLSKILYKLLKPNGTLLISFPNSLYEKTDEYGLNNDEYHLHIFQKHQVLEMLEAAGFEICEILGQSYCNEQCNLENDEVKAGILSAAALQEKHKQEVNELISDARAFAIPTDFNVDGSYSYILRCRKAASLISVSG